MMKRLFFALLALSAIGGCSGGGSMLPPPSTTTIQVTPTASGYYVVISTPTPTVQPTGTYVPTASTSPTSSPSPTPTPSPTPSPTPTPIVLACVGDSWMAGVGADPGKDVCSDIAAAIGAASTANVSHGGATTADALKYQVGAIPLNSTVVVVQIGYNDERSGADAHDAWVAGQQCALSGYTYSTYCGSASAPGYPEPQSASSIDGSPFFSDPPALAARFAAITAAIKARVPNAKIVQAIPPDSDKIPQFLSATNGGPNFPANPSLTANFGWINRSALCPAAGSTASMATWTLPCSIKDDVLSQPVSAIIDLWAAPIYVSTNFTDVPSVLGHPNDQGAAAIAALFVAAIQQLH